MGPAKKLYFIVGIGRSGTTLLTKLLNEYPEVHCLPEANFLIFFLHQYRNKKSFSESDIDLLLEEIKVYASTHPLVGWDFDPAATRAQLLEYARSGKEVSFAEICRITYSNFKVSGKDKQNASILLDKNPAYTLFLDHISDYFTEAKYIFITRDPRANVLSRKQNAYLKSKNVAYNAFRWKWFNECALQFMNDHKSQVHHLRYEDLVVNTAAEMNKLLAFLGVDQTYHVADKEAHASVSNGKVEVKEQYQGYFEKKYSDLSKPVNTSRVDAWKKELSADEISICDAICGDFAREFGYEPQKKTSGSFVSLRYFMPYLQAKLGIWKERIVYYVSPTVKMRRLKKVYKKLGFEQS